MVVKAWINSVILEFWDSGINSDIPDEDVLNVIKRLNKSEASVCSTLSTPDNAVHGCYIAREIPCMPHIESKPFCAATTIHRILADVFAILFLEWQTMDCSIK